MAVVQHPAVDRPLRPAVSVCIANFNGERMLVDCIDSVLAQGCDGVIEIIVHDDASSDASIALLRARYPQVELLASGDNVGFCVGNNRMVAHARGEFVLLLNNDAALFPDALATLLDAARGQASPGILTLPQYDWDSGDLVDRGCLLDPFYNPVPNLDPDRTEVAMVIGACLWMPRGAWDALEGFPEWFGSLAEDMFLCCKARLQGMRVAALSNSGYRHRQGGTIGGNRPSAGRLQSTYRRRQLSERNKTHTLFMATPTPIMWPLLGLHLLLLAVEGGLLALIKRDSAVITQIYRPVFASLRWNFRLLMRKRRELQRVRTVALPGYLRCFRLAPRKLALWYRYGVPTIRP